MSDQVNIKTEDNVIVRNGDIVYNYYDMRPVRIAIRESQAKRILEDIASGHIKSIKRDIWVDMEALDSDGNVIGTDILNGERICSMAFAKSRGFKNADKKPHDD